MIDAACDYGGIETDYLFGIFETSSRDTMLAAARLVRRSPRGQAVPIKKTLPRARTGEHVSLVRRERFALLTF